MGELDEVCGHGVIIAAHDADALPYFDPVAGEATERLVHCGEESGGAGACSFAGLDHEAGEKAGLVVGGHEGAGADFDVEDEGVEGLGELLAHDAGGDEEGRLDGAGVVAEGVKDAVGGDDAWGLADEGGAAFLQGVGQLGEVELGVEAGNGFQLVEGAAGVTERAAADHGDTDAGDAGRCGVGEAGGGKDGGNEEGGFVADASCGVLVDGEGVEGCGVEGIAGVAHGRGKGSELLRAEAAEEDGHEEGGDLSVGDELVVGGAVDDGADEGVDFVVGEGEAVTLVDDDVEWVDGRVHDLAHLMRRKAAGRSSAMVASATVPPSAGKKTMVAGVLNSWIVWRQAPQGWLAVALRLTMAMARMRMAGP